MAQLVNDYDDIIADVTSADNAHDDVNTDTGDEDVTITPFDSFAR